MTLVQTETATARPQATGAGILADLPAPVAFTLPVPPSVNELYRNLPGRGRVQSAVYHEFIRFGITSIRNQKVQPVPGRVMAIFGVERSSLAADIDNRLKAMLDTIVKAEVIKDDNMVTAIAVCWSPRANGLAHVILMPVQKIELSFLPSPDGASGGWYLPAPQPGEDDGYQPV